MLYLSKPVALAWICVEFNPIATKSQVLIMRGLLTCLLLLLVGKLLVWLESINLELKNRRSILWHV